VRPVAGYGLPEHLRVSIGTQAENRRFLEALAAAIDGLEGVPRGAPVAAQ
jgi:histidinol-phosphate aminotransferase